MNEHQQQRCERNPGGGCLRTDGQRAIQSLASVTGRVGYAWDWFLGYVKGGGAWVQGDFGFQVAALPVAPTVSLSQSGWTVGVGGEYAFLNWLTGFIEYDYYTFNNRLDRLAPDLDPPLCPPTNREGPPPCRAVPFQQIARRALPERRTDCHTVAYLQ